MIALLMVLACMPKDVDPADVGVGTVPVVEPPSGTVRDGVFRDEAHGFQVPLLEGWVADPGPSNGLMRVAMMHIPTDTRMEVWVFEGQGLSPRQREGCEWTFQSKGRALSVSEEVVIAVCTPNDPSSRRVFGTIFSHNNLVVQIEAHTPTDALVEGKDAADRVIRLIRW